jgi:hypothetical protein
MNSLFSIAGEPLEDPPSGRIGKSFEDAFNGVLHSETITKWLWFVKPENPEPQNIFFKFGPEIACQAPKPRKQLKRQELPLAYELAPISYT